MTARKVALNFKPLVSSVFGLETSQKVQNLSRNLATLRMGESPGPIQSAITVKLSQELKPEHLDIINESYMHNVPKGSEMHFKVIVVSDQFDGKPLIERHRLVHSVLHEELGSGAIHALSVVAKTPAQWAKSQAVESSPKCLGGAKHH